MKAAPNNVVVNAYGVRATHHLSRRRIFDLHFCGCSSRIRRQIKGPLELVTQHY